MSCVVVDERLNFFQWLECALVVGLDGSVKRIVLSTHKREMDDGHLACWIGLSPSGVHRRLMSKEMGIGEMSKKTQRHQASTF